MITNVLIKRSEGNVTIRIATEKDKEEYIAFEMNGELTQSLAEACLEKGIDVKDIIWNERIESDCIMFAIIENSSGKNVGFCEIEHISSEEPTIGITLAEQFRGKGYGYIASKLMIEEGWKIFEHPYFIWELDQDNIASKKLILKLGGKLVSNRCILPDNMIKLMREKGIKISSEDFPDSVERYKIERPKKLKILLYYDLILPT